MGSRRLVEKCEEIHSTFLMAQGKTGKILRMGRRETPYDFLHACLLVSSCQCILQHFACFLSLTDFGNPDKVVMHYELQLARVVLGCLCTRKDGREERKWDLFSPKFYSPKIR